VSDVGTAGASLRDRIKTFVGVSAKVEVAPSGTIEPSQGKARHVFDHRTAR
jgi:phenylacetate-coenzyme A ligase PaaK-like adenylate-forming protein